MKVKNIKGRKILDSTGKYALEVSIETSKGKFKASAPKGTSKGKHETKEYNYTLKSVIKKINGKIKRSLVRTKINSLNDILNYEEKTKKLGGNAVLSVSFALLKALAAEKNKPVWKLFSKKKKIPKVLNKIIGGGSHAGRNSTNFQEFLVLQKLKDIDKNLKLHKKVKEKWGSYGKDLEGGWVLDVSDEKAIQILRKYDKKSKIGLDIAASEFYRNGKYKYKNVSPVTEKGRVVMPKENKNQTEQIRFIKKLQNKYNLYYIEDPLDQEDFRGFARLTEMFGKNSLIVGDDLFVTNPERLKKGIALGACNACIVKPNQIGSLKKTIEFVKLAKENNYKTIISHRSGETNDDILADLAVGLQIPIIKIGLVGGERVSKINRLLEIKKE